jgi:pimeloyl-ACP methyl ester carboxylesterase
MPFHGEVASPYLVPQTDLTVEFHKGEKMDQSPHKSDFVTVNGVRLHYLDWGGQGPVLLFLAGLGCNAYIYNQFAPRFTDQFHAIALTRRGHGDSDDPENGYDIDTLTEDVRQFMDCLRIDQAILVGHSLAGIELSHFAAQYPERVLKLVFLDAAYDRSSAECKIMQENNPFNNIQIPGAQDDYYTIEEQAAFLQKAYPSFAAIWGELMEEHNLHEVKRTPEGKVVYKMSDEISKAISETVASYAPEDAKIQAPVLSIYAIKPNTYSVAPAYMTAEQQTQVMEFFDKFQQPWNRQCIEQFRRNVPHAIIVEISDAHHYCFIQQEELVFNVVRTFLLEG